MSLLPNRRVQGDWYDKPVPENVVWGKRFYLETTQVFRNVKATKNPAVCIGNDVSVYSGCSFSIGLNGFCSVGDFSLLNGALIMADEEIVIGKHCLISWNVGLADSDFHPVEPALRMQDSIALSAYYPNKPPRPRIETRPIRIGDNVWIGMNSVVLKGVTIGDNSIVAAGSIVTHDVPPNTMVAGNPARVVKAI